MGSSVGFEISELAIIVDGVFDIRLEYLLRINEQGVKTRDSALFWINLAKT